MTRPGRLIAVGLVSLVSVVAVAAAGWFGGSRPRAPQTAPLVCGPVQPEGARGANAFPMPSSGRLVVDVAPVEGNVLVRWVRWGTPEPATSVVEFGPTEKYARRIGDPRMTTEHEILVIGMGPASSHHARAVSVGASGTTYQSNDIVITTAALAPDILVPQSSVPRPESLAPGWTVFAHGVMSPTGGTPSTVLILDETGTPVWNFSDRASQGPGFATLTPSGRGVLLFFGSSRKFPSTLNELDLAGRVVWRGPIQDVNRATSPEYLNRWVHHSLTRLANGNFSLIRYKVPGQDAGSILSEMRPDGTFVWEWDSASHIPRPPDATRAWLKENWLDIDLERDVAYESVPSLSAVFKIDRKSGKIVWRFGEGGDFAIAPGTDRPWFHGVHAPMRVGDNHLLLFDNDDRDQKASRAVEYEYDEATKQARLVWQFPPAGKPGFGYYQVAGRAQRLVNGNTLVTFGNGESPNLSTRIVEVSPGGEVLAEFALPPRDKIPVLVYFATRIPALAEWIHRE